MNSDNSITDYAQKWLAIWPEQAILDVFAYKQHKKACQAWTGLLFELQDCAFAIEHDVVREQKSFWWADELRRVSSGSVRHPLSQALQESQADFTQLADAFIAVSGKTPIRASNTTALFETLSPFAHAISSVESQLFGGQNSNSAHAIAVQLLLMRLPHGLQAFDQALIPMHLLARHQALSTIQTPTILLNDWLKELAIQLEGEETHNWFRAAHLAICRRRINQLKNNGQIKIQIAHTWDAWRAVRSHRVL